MLQRLMKLPVYACRAAGMLGSQMGASAGAGTEGEPSGPPGVFGMM